MGVTLTAVLGGTGAGSGAALMSARVSDRASRADEVPSDNFDKQQEWKSVLKKSVNVYKCE